MLTLRYNQELLVNKIDELMNKKGKTILLVEAGTGFGKTYAYLIPIFKNESYKSIISTNSKALQLQLISKDLPFIKKEINSNSIFNYSVLYGKRNYICQLTISKKDIINTLDVREVKTFRKIKKANKGFLFSNYFKHEKDISNNFRSMFSALNKGTDCIKCKYKTCPFSQMVKCQLAIDDITIVNHHLLINNFLQWDSLVTKYPNTPSPLENKVVIIDEAHTLDGILNEAKGAEISFKKCKSDIMISSKQIMIKIVLLLESASLKNKHIIDKLIYNYDLLSITFLELINSLIDSSYLSKIKSSSKIEFFILPQYTPLVKTLREMKELVVEITQTIESNKTDKLFNNLYINSGIEYILPKLHNNFNNIIDLIANYLISDTADSIVKYYSYKNNSICIGYNDLNFDFKQFALYLGASKLLIFMSATLTTNNDFSFFKNCLKLNKELYTNHNLTVVKFKSPFDFENNMDIMIRDNTLDDKEELSNFITNINKSSLLLFTSREKMEEYHTFMLTNIKIPVYTQDDHNLEILIQMSKVQLICVLALTSFWEGVDFNDLGLVYINKLYFDNPSDLILQKKCKILEAQGFNAFKYYSTPRMITKTLQGIGRLLRNYENKGTIIINDNRIFTKNYGAILYQSLPVQATKVAKYI